MSPRPAPDLDLRRAQLIHAARDLAESDGWPAVMVGRLVGELGATQPVLYPFASRQSAFTTLETAAGRSAAAEARERNGH